MRERIRRFSCVLAAMLGATALEPAAAQSPWTRIADSAAAVEPMLSEPLPQAPAQHLADFEALALQFNPALAEARAQVEAAQGRWVQVGLRPNPVIGYAGEEMGNEGSAGQQGAFLQQTIIRGGKLDLNRQVAQQEIERAEQQWAATELRVRNDVRVAFYRVLIQQQRLAVSEQLVRVGEQAVSAAEARFQAQEGSRIDLLQARTEAQTARLNLSTARNDYQAAWRQLAALVGRPELSNRPVVGNVDAALPDLDWDTALQQLLSRSPEIGAAVAAIGQARYQFERELAGQVPDWQTQFAVQHNDSSNDTHASVQLGIPLQIYDRNQGAIRRARAELAAAEAALGRAELDLRQRLAEAFRRYQNARQQLQDYSRDILPNAEQTLELVRVGFEQGELSYLNVLTAQRTYFQANLAYLEALNEAAEAGIAIDGMLLTGSLNTAP